MSLLPTLTLHIANKNFSSWSLRPWVLMNHLKISYVERVHPFADSSASAHDTIHQSNWEKFRTFSPSGKVPCLQVGDLAIWDSMAITEFLAERYHGVWPADARARAWARCAAAEMHSGFGTLRNTCPMHCGYRIKLRTVSAELQSDLNRLQELWGQGIAQFGGPFLGGSQFTAVDAFFAPVAFRVQSYGLALNDESASYVKRILALPAMQAWYEAALAETFNDPEHDAGPLQHGDLIQDLRLSAKR